jgi:hypothetical protein
MPTQGVIKLLLVAAAMVGGTLAVCDGLRNPTETTSAPAPPAPSQAPQTTTNPAPHFTLTWGRPVVFMSGGIRFARWRQGDNRFVTITGRNGFWLAANPPPDDILEPPIIDLNATALGAALFWFLEKLDWWLGCD